MVTLVLYLVSRYVAVFGAAPEKNAALANQFFSKIKMNILIIHYFFFAPWHQGKECALMFLAVIVHFYLYTMQKHQMVATNMYP